MRRGVAVALILALSIAGTAAALSFDRAWEITMPDAVLDLAISEDGGTTAILTTTALFCVDADGTRRWEVPGRHAQTVDISGDGSLIVTGGEDLWAYDRNGTPAFRHEIGFFAFGTAVSRDGSCIAGGFDNTSLMIFRKNDTGLFEQATVAHTTEDVICIALSRDGGQIVTGEKDGMIRYYTGDGRLLWSYGTGSGTLFTSVTDDGGYVAVGADHGVAELLNGNGRLLWKQVSGERRPGIGIDANGSLIALGGEGIRFFSQDGSEICAIPAGEVTSLAVAGRASATVAGSGSTVTLYRPASGTTASPETTVATPTTSPPENGDGGQPTPAQSAAPIPAAAAIGVIIALLNRRRQG